MCVNLAGSATIQYCVQVTDDQSFLVCINIKSRERIHDLEDSCSAKKSYSVNSYVDKYMLIITKSR